MRLPPGRAGRLWLQRRLETAHRGADVLEQKRQALLRERERTARTLADAAAIWSERAPAAADWNDRVLALAGVRRLRLAPLHGGKRATVDVRWRNAFGALIPDEVQVEDGAASVQVVSGGAPGVALAARAHGDALAAAAAFAAARAAHEAVDAELRATTRRLRAIEQRWIPGHEMALRGLEIALAERELEDIVRSRYAVERRSTTRPRG